MGKKKKKNAGGNVVATNRRARHDYNILEYSLGTWTNHRPMRHRKLLLHRKEIDSLEGKVRDGNKTLVPLKLYFKDGLLKAELALAQGKQDYDKREDIKRRTEEREVVRELGRRVKGIKA